MTVYMNRDGGVAACKNVYMNRDGGVADCKGVRMNYDGSNLRKVHAKIQSGTLESKAINFSKDGRDAAMTTTHEIKFSNSYVFKQITWGKQWKNIDGNSTPLNLVVTLYGSSNGGSNWVQIGSDTIVQNYIGNRDITHVVTISNTTSFNALRAVFTYNGPQSSNANKRCNLYAAVTTWS